MIGPERNAFALLLFASMFAALLVPNAMAAGQCQGSWDCQAQQSSSGCTSPCSWACVSCEGPGSCNSCNSCPSSQGCSKSMGCSGATGLQCSGYNSQTTCQQHVGCSWNAPPPCGGDGASCSGTGQSTCCAGLACYSGTCHSNCVNLNELCGASNLGKGCCSGNGNCVDVGGGTYRCQNCAPPGASCTGTGTGNCCTTPSGLLCKTDNHLCESCSVANQHCGNSGDCCSGLLCDSVSHMCKAACSLGSSCAVDADCCPSTTGFSCGQATHTCCKAIYSSCTANAECCSNKCYGGKCIANKPPAQPGAPYISAEPQGANLALACTHNCPPVPLPSDPEGDTVHMEYSWYMDGAPFGGWSAASPPPPTTCTSASCPSGTAMSMKSRACDSPASTSCTESSMSNSIQITWGNGGVTGLTNMVYWIYAFVGAIALLALAYMASYAFSLAHIRPILQDELLQVLATGAVAFLLLSLSTGIDSISSDMMAASGYTGSATTIMAAAQGVLGTAGLEGKASGILNDLAFSSIKIGQEASKGIFCNFLGVGFTLVNCSPLNAFRGALTSSAFTATVALADTYAQQFILSMAQNYAFTFIVPLGLFLRCFKMGRQAGSALIAVGFGFYTIYPAVVVGTELALHGTNPSSSPGMPALTGNNGECNPSELDVSVSRGQFTDYANGLTEFSRVEAFAYVILVRVLFMSILNLIITLGFIRALAHVLGSDIDVSALARIS